MAGLGLGLDFRERNDHGRFGFGFPYYKEVLYRLDFKQKRLGKLVVFDMDMSARDFLALFYLLKIPVEVINLKVYCYKNVALRQDKICLFIFIYVTMLKKH